MAQLFHMGKKIGLTYDLKSDWQASSDDPVDAAAELDSSRTVECLKKAFESAGHTVKLIGGVKHLLKMLPDPGVDIVFNIAEGHRGRNREAQVPLILELFNIPFAGADALTLGLTLDKVAAKKCFIADGIPTARYFKATAEDDLGELNTIGFPLFVKTLHEGTSKGITPGSRAELIDQFRDLPEYAADISEAHLGTNFKCMEAFDHARAIRLQPLSIRQQGTEERPDQRAERDARPHCARKQGRDHQGRRAGRKQRRRHEPGRTALHFPLAPPALPS